MTDMPSAAATSAAAAPRPLWRIDRFLTPVAARATLLARLRRTHSDLERMAGCLVSRIVAAPPVEGKQELLTLAAWRDEAAFQAARMTMQRVHAETGFDPAAFLSRHGITMTPTVYRDVVADDDLVP